MYLRLLLELILDIMGKFQEFRKLKVEKKDLNVLKGSFFKVLVRGAIAFFFFKRAYEKRLGKLCTIYFLKIKKFRRP